MYHRADIIDAELWKTVKAIVTEPGSLPLAFREYQLSLHSDVNPVRDRLEKKQKLISSAERELSQLVYLFTKEKITETQFDQMKADLDIQLSPYMDEVDALSDELSQTAAKDQRLHTIGEFASTAAHALKAAEKDHATKRKFLQGLEFGAGMSQDRHHKYVDWYIFTPDVLSVWRKGQLNFSG